MRIVNWKTQEKPNQRTQQKEQIKKPSSSLLHYNSFTGSTQ